MPSDHWAILVILQGMDTSGKDGVIKHVMSGVNPQGCEVHSFKAPSEQELDHDFLWRASVALPPRGTIGIFNRSYYEEMMVVRVHPELLAESSACRRSSSPTTSGSSASTDINNFELHLARNGIVPIKFFLNMSKEEQLERLAGAHRRSGQALEVRRCTMSRSASCGTSISQAYEDTIRDTATKACAVVRRAGRPQMVHAARGRRRAGRAAGGARSEISEARRSDRCSSWRRFAQSCVAEKPTKSEEGLKRDV